MIDYFDSTAPASLPPPPTPRHRLRAASASALTLLAAAIVVWTVGLWWSFLTVLVILSLGSFGPPDDGIAAEREAKP